MNIWRTGLHSLVLVIADLAGIAGGAQAAFWLLRTPNEVWLQLPIAVLVSVGSFAGWVVSLRVFGCRRLQLATAKERVVCLALSVFWAPVVFVPLHYFTQGYLTGVGNLVVLALYQMPVNAIALLITSLLAPEPESSCHSQ